MACYFWKGEVASENATYSVSETLRDLTDIIQLVNSRAETQNQDFELIPVLFSLNQYLLLLAWFYFVIQISKTVILEPKG